MMENAQQRLVVAQFGPRAKAYVESVVHAQGADLDALCALIKSRPAHRVLDLGCGGGHVSFSIAPLVEHVTAYDLAPSMLAAAERLAQDRGLTNLSFEQGAVESLPFADQSFDMVVSRYSAHHWSDLARALQEAHRVLTPSGRAIFMDVIAPERPVLDSFLQTLEMLRDPSHVRNYKISEWTRALAAAGFTPGVTTPRRLYLDFASWIARMNTPAPHVAAIRSLQALAAEDVKTHFAVEADGSFTIDTASFEAAA
ncbi:MAG TPA: class I SAM-dependent methyltransferase [Methylovirgula sp.]